MSGVIFLQFCSTSSKSTWQDMAGIPSPVFPVTQPVCFSPICTHMFTCVLAGKARGQPAVLSTPFPFEMWFHCVPSAGLELTTRSRALVSSAGLLLGGISF